MFSSLLFFSDLKAVCHFVSWVVCMHQITMFGYWFVAILATAVAFLEQFLFKANFLVTLSTCECISHIGCCLVCVIDIDLDHTCRWQLWLDSSTAWTNLNGHCLWCLKVVLYACDRAAWRWNEPGKTAHVQPGRIENIRSQVSNSFHFLSSPPVCTEGFLPTFWFDFKRSKSLNVRKLKEMTW